MDAVFISDLHLHPDDSAIFDRFCSFIRWAAAHTKSVYILGDFFHVWPGDDAMDTWSASIANRLAWLSHQGVKLYFMPGNRDFLLGQRFMHQAHCELLTEPTIIQCDQQRVLLVHGDRYCLQDKAHQWLRRLTRNRMFVAAFGHIPYAWRACIVNAVRDYSQSNRHKPLTILDVVPEACLAHMDEYGVNHLIHGHTHRPGRHEYQRGESTGYRFVLSDWDDSPKVLCYNKASGFNFIQI